MELLTGRRQRPARLAAHLASLVVAPALALALTAGPVAPAAAAPDYRPGADGAGDPYYPQVGNGGYDVRHYALSLRYKPRTDRLSGTATLRARATQPLSRFSLDLEQLRVRRVRVDGRAARWRHRDGELMVDPAGPGLRRGERFRVEVRYGGVPVSSKTPFGSVGGVLHTHDGLLVAGQPRVAATWFPVNDHPTDTATYTFEITAPASLEVVANGVLRGRREQGRWATWRWVAREPMAPYLATVNIGESELVRYRRDGIRYWDAVDPRLMRPVAKPRTGARFAISDRADSSYKRLARTLDVPADGARLELWMDHDVEADWDFVLVEARPAGTGEWTTLRDERGHTSRSSGLACPGILREHPSLRRYLTARGERCRPVGRTGRWHAATGASDGYERWVLDLDRYAGQAVELAISYVSDFIVQRDGVFVDDVTVRHADGTEGPGSTSFEVDADPADGWSVLGPPPRSPGNSNDWVLGTVADGPPGVGAVARESFARQPEMIRFLELLAGPYPFTAAGGIVDHAPRFGFALETQTRPVYSQDFFVSALDGDLVVVHELAHQWYGDSVTLRRWRHIWLNEGPATYAEWMWLERERVATARSIFRSIYDSIPGRDPFWSLDLVDPGPDHLLDQAVYVRGAMVLHVLRTKVGDRDFARIMRRWAQGRAGVHVTTGQFVRLAERVSDRRLDRLFDRWLFTPRKPDRAAAPGLAGSAREASKVTARLLDRYATGAHGAHG